MISSAYCWICAGDKELQRSVLVGAWGAATLPPVACVKLPNAPPAPGLKTLPAMPAKPPVPRFSTLPALPPEPVFDAILAPPVARFAEIEDEPPVTCTEASISGLIA